MGAPVEVEQPDKAIIKDLNFEAKPTLVHTAAKLFCIVVCFFLALFGLVYVTSAKSGNFTGFWQMLLASAGFTSVVVFAIFNLYSLSNGLNRKQEKKAIVQLFSRETAKSAVWKAAGLITILIFCGVCSWLATMPLWTALAIICIAISLFVFGIMFLGRKNENWTKEQAKDTSRRALWAVTKAAFWMAVAAVAWFMIFNWFSTIPSWASVIVILLALIYFKL